MKDKIYLSSPHMGGNEINFINQAFEANWIAPLGPNVTHFENSIQDYLGSGTHAAALSSGTAAIHLALILLGVGKDDEVLCQSMTFSASANPIVYQGAIPVFIDSELDTWNMCPELLETAILDRRRKGKNPKAIIAVHLYGMPYKVEELRAISEKYSIPIIEDSAEALGSSYKGQKCGSFGDISILSFNGNKIITTSGGGALISKKLEYKNKAIYLATQARDDAPYYQHSEIGYNYRLSNVSAGIGCGQMQVLDSHVKLRREMNLFYQDLFCDIDDINVFVETNDTIFSNHWLSCITFSEISSSFNPEALRNKLLEDNIESRPLWKPMHLQPVFRDAPFYENGTAKNLFVKGLCLPSGSNLNDGERQRITKVVKSYLNNT